MGDDHNSNDLGNRPCAGPGFLERSAMMTEFVEISVNFKALGISLDGEIDKESAVKMLDILLRAETRKGKDNDKT